MIGLPQSLLRCRSFCAAALMLALVGCATQDKGAGVENTMLRNPSVPFGGTSRFDGSLFAGAWQTDSCLGTCAESEIYQVATDGVYLRKTGGKTVDYIVTAPGVLRRQGHNEILVVMWVDTGFRTAVVGDADGRWAAIIDRKTPSADRRAAAIEILDFNGWDVSRLKRVTK